MQDAPVTADILSQLATISFNIDANLSIQNSSEVLRHYLPLCEGERLDAIFNMVRPNGNIHIDTFRDNLNRMVLLISKEQTYAIRGQFVRTAEAPEKLFFFGAPWLSWIAQNVPEQKMRMEDFAVTDVQLDQMIFVSTEQKNLQDLKNLADKLKDARDKAEQANEQRSEFFALMSHEMRTPLNGVASALELVEDEPLDDESLKMLRIARRSTDNLKRLIDQVLNYSKLQAGGFVNEPHVFDLNRTLGAIMDIYLPLLQVEKNRMRLDCQPVDCLFIADEAKLRQVLINIVSNAVKYTHGGEILISTSVDEKKGELILGIRDNGEGIPFDFQKKLFDSYASFESVRGQSRGTGLGLNVCKRFVEIMDGEISFESVPGEGTDFKITLPVGIEYDMTLVSSENQGSNYFSGHILIVEDNKTNQYLGKKMLERRGLTVEIANHGVEAIERISRRKNAGEPHYNIVFMDISMPVMDGIEATNALRQEFDLNELPIIAMTAHASDTDHRQFLGAGMNSVVSKPIDMKILDETLANWCELAEPPLLEIDKTRRKVSKNRVEKDGSENEFLIMRQALSLQEELGDEVYIQIARVFEKEALERFVEMEDAYENEDMDVLSKKAHSIRSSAATLGCWPLANLLKAIELDSRESRQEALKTNMSDLSELVTNSIKSLKNYTISIKTDG